MTLNRVDLHSRVEAECNVEYQWEHRYLSRLCSIVFFTFCFQAKPGLVLVLLKYSCRHCFKQRKHEDLVKAFFAKLISISFDFLLLVGQTETQIDKPA